MRNQLAQKIAAAEARGAAAATEACRAIIREMAEAEEEVGATWEKEAKDADPSAGLLHLRACEAIGHSFRGFGERLRELADELPASSDLTTEVQRIEGRGAAVAREEIAKKLEAEADAAEARAHKRGSGWSDRAIDLRSFAASIRSGEI